MKYAVDTSVAIKTVVAEADSDKAIQLRDDYNNAVHDLIVPDLYPAEICNVLMMLERSGKIGAGQAALFLRSFLQDLPVLFDAAPLLPRALEISQQFRQSVYDCLYVALAEREGCELVTADDKLIKAVQPTMPFVISLAMLP
jgi:predicted nucleic acid-binding protein